MKNKSFFHLQLELINGLNILTNDEIALIQLPNESIRNNNIRQNALLVASSMEPFLNQFDKNTNTSSNFFTSYYTFLILADELEKISTLLSHPSNFIEYTYYYYAIFMLDRIEKHAVINEKLKTIIDSPYADAMSKNYSQLVLDFQLSTISDKEFYSKLESFYNNYFGFFYTHLTFTSVFLRINITFLQNSHFFSNIIQEWFDFADKLNFEFSSMLLSHLLGLIYGNYGKLETSKNFNERSLKTSSVCKYLNEDITKNNLGNIFTAIGSHEKGCQIYLELYHNHPHNVVYLLNLAETYLFLDEYDKGINVITEFENENGPLRNFNNNYALEVKFLLYLKLNKLSEALAIEQEAGSVESVAQVITVNKHTFNKIKAQRYQYEGNLALAKQKMDEVLKIAEDLNSVHELFNDYILLIEIQLDLVISRPKIQEYKNQLFSMLDMVINLTDEQNIIYQKVNLLALRSEVYRHFELFDEANNDLQNAKNLALENGFDELFTRLTQEIAKMNVNVRKTNDNENDSITFLKRLKNAFKVLVGSPVSSNEMKKIEYTIHGVLILSDSGVNIFSHYFSDLLQSDPSLISALILAITSFIKELSRSDGLLKSINHENMTLILEPLENFICVSISSKDCFEVREKSRKFASLSRKIIIENSKSLEKGVVQDNLIDQLSKNVETVF